MSQISELLQIALAGTFANGLWPGKARDACPVPYGTFTHFGDTRYYLSGRSGDQHQRVQIDCWAADDVLAGQLADAVEAAMDVPSLNSSPSMFTATQLTRALMPQDPETDNQRVLLEFSVWYRP